MSQTPTVEAKLRSDLDALYRAIDRATKPRPLIPALAPGQTSFQVWSEPDWQYGYRTLLTFELRESVR